MMRENSPEIVVVGGGAGSSVTLNGLRRRNIAPSAIVTAFDSGGSSGRLRDEFGHLALGDIRQCLTALAEESPETEAFRLATQYRFTNESSLNGHNLGDLFLSALTDMHTDIEIAVRQMARMLRISGQVVPVTLDRADLCAELVDGSVLRGESTINLSLRRYDPSPIKRVYLDRDVRANERAIQAIYDADLIVLGPGDLYTSIIPNLLVRGVAEAIEASRARTVFVCNVMTKHGETDGFTPADFLREISIYLGGAPVDYALINSTPVSIEAQSVYSGVNAKPVELTSDLAERLQPWSRQQICIPLSEELVPAGEDEMRVRHDPDRLAAAIIGLFDGVNREQTNTVTGGEVLPVAD